MLFQVGSNVSSRRKIHFEALRKKCVKITNENIRDERLFFLPLKRVRRR
jgi:hypothetical protein